MKKIIKKKKKKIKGLICRVNKKWRYHFVATLPISEKTFFKKKSTAALSIQYFY